MKHKISKINHKPIKCPQCGRRLIDEDVSSNTKIIANPDSGYNADYYIKCSKCASEIGIIKIK